MGVEVWLDVASVKVFSKGFEGHMENSGGDKENPRPIEICDRKATGRPTGIPDLASEFSE